MTDIPPVEERQVRPCWDDCVFFNENYRTCRLSMPERYNSAPCDKHFTRKEMQELIDQHNAGERRITGECDTCTRYCDPRKPLSNPCPDYRPEQQPRQEG